MSRISILLALFVAAQSYAQPGKLIDATLCTWNKTEVL